MTLTVEDGTGLTTADAYVSQATCEAYATARGLTFSGTNTEKEQAIRRATQWIDANYRNRWQGYRTHGRAQALDWPRVGEVDYGASVDVASNIVPVEVVNATCEAAIREAATPGSLAPDLERGGAVRRYKAGSVEIEYAAGASSLTVFRQIELAIGPLLSMSTGVYVGRAVRG